MIHNPLMPAAFVGHGSPMNTLEDNRFTDAWKAFGASVPTPRAVLCISAHWYINATAVTAMAVPRVIHDFYGFPDELFAYDYPAPGHPEVAELVADVAKPQWVGLDLDSWGLDHGTWSVLAHMFPDADIPVVQLSINASQPLGYHLDIGARLAPLRREGILIVASGNIVHNLRSIDWSQPDGAAAWNSRFDESASELLRERPGDILELTDHADFDLAVPTPDHFIPMLYLAALAAEADDTPEILVEGPSFGSISMTSYALGADCPPSTDVAPTQSTMIASAPPDQTNI
ncbi:4,5-DOPA dioxygenase extradiol [Aquihabitans sp. G128]|nr:4,5-DOPA dioxygenase extradiol [Aquihabitans sp. G128]QXC60528.1 4,5-DOPA dioxygenase extradiol [Aquihabitans sp. G128]